MSTLVDADVLLDILTEDPAWFEWSARALVAAAAAGELAINPIIYAEIAVGFETVEDLNDALDGLQRLALPYDAGFLAAKCFVRYRRAGGAPPPAAGLLHRRSRGRERPAAADP